MKSWKQENGGFVAAHHQESSLNLALQSVTFHLCEPPAQGTAFLLPREPPMKKQDEMRAEEFGLARTLLAVLLPWPDSLASPARSILTES